MHRIVIESILFVWISSIIEEKMSCVSVSLIRPSGVNLLLVVFVVSLVIVLGCINSITDLNIFTIYILLYNRKSKTGALYIHYNKSFYLSNRMSICILYVAKVLANHWTDIILLNCMLICPFCRWPWNQPYNAKPHVFKFYSLSIIK